MARSFFSAVEMTPVPRDLVKKKNVVGLRADISPNSVRIHSSGDRIAELNVFVADRMAADDAALRFRHFVQATADDLFQNRGSPFSGKPTSESAETGRPPMA